MTGEPRLALGSDERKREMNSKKILAVILAALTMLTLAVAPASATGGPPDPCKKHDCPPPPPPCRSECPAPTPPPAPVRVCYDQEALRIAERRGQAPKFVDVSVTITGTDGEDFVVEYQANRESSQARTLDGGQLDGPYSGTFAVRAWRDVDGIVRVRVWDEGCNSPVPNITVEFSA